MKEGSTASRDKLAALRESHGVSVSEASRQRARERQDRQFDEAFAAGPRAGKHPMMRFESPPSRMSAAFDPITGGGGGSAASAVLTAASQFGGMETRSSVQQRMAIKRQVAAELHHAYEQKLATMRDGSGMAAAGGGGTGLGTYSFATTAGRPHTFEAPKRVLSPPPLESIAERPQSVW